MSNLLSSEWWKAAVIRALRTALVIAVPYSPTVLYDGNYVVVLSAIGFGALSSLVTSLFGIAETTGGNVPWHFAVFERVVKTAAQSLLTVFGTATLFSDVDWSQAPALVASAVLGSLLLGVLGQLPEATDPAVATKSPITVVVTNPTTALTDAGEYTPEASMDAATLTEGTTPDPEGARSDG